MTEQLPLKVRRLISMASRKPFSEVCAALQGQFGFDEFRFEPDICSVWGHVSGEGIELRIQAQVTSSVIAGPHAPADGLTCVYGITLLTDGREFEFTRFESFLREILEPDQAAF